MPSDGAESGFGCTARSGQNPKAPQILIRYVSETELHGVKRMPCGLALPASTFGDIGPVLRAGPPPAGSERGGHLKKLSDGASLARSGHVVACVMGRSEQY